MESKLNLYSVVYVGEPISPPDFKPSALKNKGVIDDSAEWNLTGQALMIPQITQLVFENKLCLVVEQGKVQIIDSALIEPMSSGLKQFAQALLRTAKGIRFQGIGINFQHVIFCDDPEAIIISHFLKDGVALTKDDKTRLSSLSWVRDQGNTRLTIKIDGGFQQEINVISGEKSEPKRVLIFGTNYHKDCSTNSTYEYALSHLESLDDAWHEHLEIFGRINPCQ